jgi:tetratricopeptide (TPR) repeat protein
MNARILFTNKLMKLNILCRNLIIHHSNFFYPGIKSNALKRTLQIVKRNLCQQKNSNQKADDNNSKRFFKFTFFKFDSLIKFSTGSFLFLVIFGPADLMKEARNFYKKHYESEDVAQSLQNADNKIEIVNDRISRNELFIGRTDVFNEINNRLASKDKKSVLLYGLPGVGKTSCAIEFILKKKQNREIDNYFYFPSDKDYKIQNAVSSFCKQLNLTSENDKIETKIEKFTKHLMKTNEKIILFFDNVDDFEVLNQIIDYKSINKPTILTSRFNAEQRDSILIKPFNKIDSKNYLLEKLPDLTSGDINLILNNLKVKDDEYLTYKIVDIAAILQNNPSTTVSVLFQNGFKDDYLQNLLSGLEEKSKDAIKILKYLYFLDADEIPDILLNKFSTELEDTLKILTKNNLCKRINKNSPKVGVSIHRILKTGIFNHYFRENENDYKKIEKDLIDYFIQLFPKIEKNPDDKWKRAEILYSNVKQVIAESKLETYEIGKLHELIMSFEMWVNNDSKKSLEHGLKAYNIISNLFKDNNREVSHLLNSIAISYEILNKYEKALEYYEKSLNMKRKIFKGDHGDIAITINNIGLLRSKMGKYDLALKLFEESLQMSKRSGYDTLVAKSLLSIGWAYMHKREFDKALDFMLKSLEMRKKVIHSNHKDIAESLYYIGIVYCRMGKHKLALDWFNKALDIREKIYPIGHKNIEDTKNKIEQTIKDDFFSVLYL